MTLRDFWEVLTFQVSWADSNIFIVLLAIVILIFGTLLLFGLLMEILEGIANVFHSLREKWLEKEYSDEELEKREKRALWAVPIIIIIILFVVMPILIYFGY